MVVSRTTTLLTAPRGDDYSGWIVRGVWQERQQDVKEGSSDLVVRMPIPPRKPARPTR